MKKYKKQICLIVAVCLLGTAAFCGYHIYDHYADEAEQTEAFENIAEIVEQAQAEDGNAPEVPLTEEENILTEYGELYLKNTDMVGWLSIAGTSSFPKLLEKNNLRHIRFHDLRHSCASLLLANGVPMKQIQEWLGHSDFSTTANVYAHLDYNSKLSSADAMVNGLSGALEAIS